MSAPKPSGPYPVPPQFELPDPDLIAVLATKTGAERLAIAAGMWRSAQRMLTSQLRFANPSWSDAEVAAEVARRLALGSG